MTDVDFFYDLLKDQLGFICGDCEYDGGPGTIMVMQRPAAFDQEDPFYTEQKEIVLYFDPSGRLG